MDNENAQIQISGYSVRSSFSSLSLRRDPCHTVDLLVYTTKKNKPNRVFFFFFSVPRFLKRPIRPKFSSDIFCSIALKVQNLFDLRTKQNKTEQTFQRGWKLEVRMAKKAEAHVTEIRPLE